MSEIEVREPDNRYQRFLQDLPHDWQQLRVRQLGKVVGGGTPSRNVMSFWRGAIPWATPSEVSSGIPMLLWDTNEHISVSALSSSGANLLPPGSLMVTTRATLGARAINAVPMATNQGFKSIVFDTADDSRFYLHAFDKVKPEISRRASGTTFLEISGAEFCEIRLPSPPHAEKRKIAEVLDTLDTAIHETEALIAKLKAVKQGLLHDLLTRGIDANGELRPPQAEAPHLYKSSPLGWIPFEWSVRRLGACASIAGGVTLGRDLAGPNSVELPYLRVANVQDGYFDLASVKQVRVLTDEIERYKLMDGDVLMNEGGDYDKLGRGAVWRSQIEPCLHQNHVFRVRCDPSCLDADFLAFYTASSGGKRFFLLSSKQSTNLASINLTQLKAFPIPCPELDEQQKIVAAVRSSERQAESEDLQLSSLRELKSGLMDDLLTGRVRVTPLLDAATA